MPAIRRPTTPLKRLAFALLVVALFATAGLLAWWSWTLTGALEGTYAELQGTERLLGTREVELSETQGRLEDTRRTLASTQTTLDGERRARQAAEKRIEVQTRCIGLLNARIDDLAEIRRLMSANFNRTAQGSAWGNASAARVRALNTALEYYYNGFASAYDGDRIAANNWIAQGNAQIREATAQGNVMAGEIAAINTATSAIGAELAAFNTKLGESVASCAG